MRWAAADERRHDDAPGLESWGFEFAGAPGSGCIRLTLDAARGRAAFVADFDLARLGRLVVADESVPLPRPTAGLEIRAEGLWASLYCETAFEHWTLGLEAFGLRLDDGPPEPRGGSWDDVVGERLAVGFDLEWETAGPPEALAEGAGYTQPGTCVGEILVERARVAVDAPAVRDHWWGGGPGIRTEPQPGLLGT